MTSGPELRTAILRNVLRRGGRVGGQRLIRVRTGQPTMTSGTHLGIEQAVAGENVGSTLREAGRSIEVSGMLPDGVHE